LADLPPRRDIDDDGGMPRWVKVFGVTVLILLLVFVVVHLAGRGLGGHTSH
jgi:hypothetical protein